MTDLETKTATVAETRGKSGSGSGSSQRASLVVKTVRNHFPKVAIQSHLLDIPRDTVRHTTETGLPMTNSK